MDINVFMLHSVGSNHTSWCEKFLSIDKRQFEVLCKRIAKNKLNTYFLDKWYYLEDHPEEKKSTDLFLTFDDGYLDNLLVAYPIMRKYGVKGTVFINPEFVDPSSGIRTEDESREGTLGFLNWDEIKFLDKSGVIDIQSHSMSHNFYFSSDELIDLYEGQSEYHFMPWVAKPSEKPFWQYSDQSAYIEPGTPVFKYYRALGLRRYFPDEKLNRMAADMYAAGKPKPEILSVLRTELKRYPGLFESDEEMEERYRYELFESKRILEERLGKNVDFLCWPGGGYNELSLRLAREAGYKASTIASKDTAEFYDNKGRGYKRIKRSGLSSTIYVRGGRKAVNAASYLYWRVRKTMGSEPYGVFLKFFSLFCLVFKSGKK